MNETENQHMTCPMTTLGAFRLGPRRRVSLLVYHRDGIAAAQLVEGQQLVVGREAPADVCVAHTRLSRQHARFELRDGNIFVEDLGSTNGTFIDGEPATGPVQVQVGRDVIMGDVSVSSHSIAVTDGHLPGLSGHDRFVTLLAEEIIRHQLFGRKLGLVVVQASERQRGQLGAWCGRIRRLLRPVDRLALYSMWAVEIALPEVDEATLRRITDAIVNDRGPGEPPLRCGAVVCPDAATSADALLEAARTAVEQTSARRPIQLSVGHEARTLDSSPLVATSPAMQRVVTMVERLARASIPVLIVGETGCGKEVVSQEIHARSPRSDRPLRCVNCASIPNSLIESLLFGHEKGAFTGAERRADGLFREAEGGTVLLDEIGELSAEAQASLLRTLETKRVARVGSTEEEEVDVRVLTATHRDLESMCDAGGFRWDLLYRINTMTLKIPPLRERAEEIPRLVDIFLEQANAANGFSIQGVEPEVLDLLLNHPWPGNVRELRNVIYRAVVLALGDRITIEDLPRGLCHGAAGDAGSQGGAPAPDAAAELHAEELATDGELDYRERVQRFESWMITRALAASGGNQTAAARQLGLPVRTLSHKIQAFGIKIPG